MSTYWTREERKRLSKLLDNDAHISPLRLDRPQARRILATVDAQTKAIREIHDTTSATECPEEDCWICALLAALQEER